MSIVHKFSGCFQWYSFSEASMSYLHKVGGIMIGPTKYDIAYNTTGAEPEHEYNFVLHGQARDVCSSHFRQKVTRTTL